MKSGAEQPRDYLYVDVARTIAAAVAGVRIALPAATHIEVAEWIARGLITCRSRRHSSVIIGLRWLCAVTTDYAES